MENDKEIPCSNCGAGDGCCYKFTKVAILTPSNSGELKSNSDRIIDLTERIRIETYQKILRRGEPELAKVNNEVITLLQCQGQQKVYCQELEDKIDTLEKELAELKGEPVGKLEEKETPEQFYARGQYPEMKDKFDRSAARFSYDDMMQFADDYIEAIRARN